MKNVHTVMKKLSLYVELLIPIHLHKDFFKIQ